MKVILKQDIENLGRKGDTVEVAPGYGRNYLIPKKLALEITPSNLKMIEIERLNTDREVKMLRGTEVDVLKDGDLDFPDEILEELDLVVAAVHLGFKQDVTDRIIKAIENPNVDIIAHPTCRLIGEREPVAIDLEALFQAAAKYSKIVEINAMPDRLDLKDVHAFRARDLGVKLVIGTDAHSIAHMDFMRFGIGVARRAWCEPQHILNTMSLTELLAILNIDG